MAKVWISLKDLGYEYACVAFLEAELLRAERFLMKISRQNHCWERERERKVFHLMLNISEIDDLHWFDWCCEDCDVNKGLESSDIVITLITQNYDVIWN